MLTNMIDYVKETATGKIIAGNTTHLWEMIHTLTFMRTIGTKTSEHPESFGVLPIAPNCQRLQKSPPLGNVLIASQLSHQEPLIGYFVNLLVKIYKKEI